MPLTPSPCHKLSHFFGPPTPRSSRTLWTVPYIALHYIVQNQYVTQSMKRYRVLVHSFVRKQPKRRWGSIFAQMFLFSHRVHIFVVYSYAFNFVIGRSFYIKSQKVRMVSRLTHQRFSDKRGGELYLSTAHRHYFSLSVCLLIILNTVALIFSIVISHGTPGTALIKIDSNREIFSLFYGRNYSRPIFLKFLLLLRINSYLI